MALQVEVAVQGIDQHLDWGEKDFECLWQKGDGWVKFDLHDRIWVTLGI